MRRALVIGCEANVWDDVRRAEEMCSFDAIYCVKMAGVYFPRAFQVWATLHPEFIKQMVADRAAKGHPNGFETVAPLESDLGDHAKYPVDRRVAYRWSSSGSSSGSGLYGAKVAIHDGFDRVVLAGCPMTKTMHFYRHARWQEKPWESFKDFDKGMIESRGQFAGRVRSVSGRTMEVFGAPDAEWLEGRAA